MNAVAERVRAASGGRMRAWRVHCYGGELQMDAARVPPLRAPDQLLVRVCAAGLNPIDAALTRGYGARALGALRALTAPADELPLQPGRDVLGVVERAGPAARLRPGARVWAALPPHVAGSHAHYALVRDSWAGPAPEALSDTEAGGAPYAALTACSALRVAGLAPGGRGAERVLLLGLGGVGQAALQLLAARGARVTVGCSSELHALATSMGAAEVLDRHAADYDAQLERAGPFEVVMDCAGLGGWEAGARRWRFGRYVTLTSPVLRESDARGLAMGAAAAAAQLVAQNARAASVSAGGATGACPPRVRWAFFAPSAADLELVRALADRGRFQVAVERVFPWWEAVQAYEHAAQSSARGKLVLDFTARHTDTAQ